MVFGSASLATLAFLATNSNSVLANGDLGLQQVIRAACGRARVVARDKILLHACANRVARGVACPFSALTADTTGAAGCTSGRGDFEGQFGGAGRGTFGSRCLQFSFISSLLARSSAAVASPARSPFGLHCGKKQQQKHAVAGVAACSPRQWAFLFATRAREARPDEHRQVQTVGGKLQRIIALRADGRAWPRRAGSANRIQTCVAQNAILYIARVVSSLFRHPVVPTVTGSTPSAPNTLSQPAPRSTPVVVSGEREPRRESERERERGREAGRAGGRGAEGAGMWRGVCCWDG